MSLDIKGQRNKKNACTSFRSTPTDSSVILSSRFATNSRRRINGDGFARDSVQEDTIAHGDQGQGHGCMAAKAKGKSGGKLNEQKREEMEGSTVAPNKNGGWDREFVYECDDDRVPSNFEFRPLFDLFDD